MKTRTFSLLLKCFDHSDQWGATGSFHSTWSKEQNKKLLSVCSVSHFEYMSKEKFEGKLLDVSSG